MTRREQRDLDIEIGFMEGVVRNDPKFFEAWKTLSHDYARRGRHGECLMADVRLAKLKPQDPEVLYNLACSYSMARQIDHALAALSRAISRGFADYKWLLRDPDLANVRKDPRFKKIWCKISSAQTV